MGKITEIFRREIRLKLRGPFEIGRGKPLPLGASITPKGINFAIFSEHATSVTLLLIHQNETKPFLEIELDPKFNKTGHIWHVHVFELSPKVLYSYRMDGPYNPQKGHRYQKHISLLDPYCKSLSGGKKWGETESNRYSCIVNEQFDWEADTPLLTPMENTIIYEMHVRGFTISPSSNSQYPGTFRGIIEKIPYLKELGITAVELMPICEFNENENPNRNPFTNEPLKNFWGYNTVSFFAPKASYAARNKNNQHLQEFKELVRSLHKAGIEVILDVVFNHTAEGNENGPTLHFRGIDNSVYYLLASDGSYLNFSGCGNTVNCNHPLIRDFIISCLHYWVTEMHVDGFRFDLASILGRAEDGSVLENPPLIEKIARDPVLANTKLIAEAWDASGLYQVGSFPACGRWAEWNSQFRDDVRCFLRGDQGKAYSLAMRLLGSPDIYEKTGRHPYHSINFVTCHDGFTLYDLVSYNQKHNQMNGENNRDGANENFSWNCGVEGPTDDPNILQLRKQQIKNFLAILLLSQGVPMLLAGDEFCRTQEGNNNAYCQDNEISWINWKLAQENKDILRFTKSMIAFRRRHPVLRNQRFLKGEYLQCEGIHWHGVKVDKPDWSEYSHSLAFLLEGCAVPEQDQDIYVAINAYWEALEFEIPCALSGQPWHICVDTSLPSPSDFVSEIEPNKRRLTKTSYTVKPRSLIILIAC